jgi:hypothetical protein
MLLLFDCEWAGSKIEDVKQARIAIVAEKRVMPKNPVAISNRAQHNFHLSCFAKSAKASAWLSFRRQKLPFSRLPPRLPDPPAAAKTAAIMRTESLAESLARGFWRDANSLHQ